MKPATASEQKSITFPSFQTGDQELKEQGGMWKETMQVMSLYAKQKKRGVTYYIPLAVFQQWIGNPKESPGVYVASLQQKLWRIRKPKKKWQGLEDESWEG